MGSTDDAALRRRGSDISEHRALGSEPTKARMKVMVTAVAESPEELVAEGAFRIAEACKFAGLSRSFLYGEMDAGRLKYAKCGRSRRIPKRELVRYLAANLKG